MSTTPRGMAQDGEPDARLVELLRLFLEDLRCEVAEMRGALQSGEMGRLSMLAHRLKGAAGCYGFPEITQQAALVETAARQGRGAEAIASGLASLEALCTRARAG